MIFEVEKEGLAGEPARARMFLKLAGISAALTLILWYITPWIGVRVLAAMSLLGTVYVTARALFHLLTVGIIRLPESLQPAAQILVAGLVAIPPFFYFIGQEDIAPISLNLTSWGLWATTIITMYLSYLVAANMKPTPPVRGYILAVAMVTALVMVSGYGGGSGDEDGGGISSSTAELPDPTSPEGKRAMAYNYLRMLLASYIGLTGSLVFKRS
jgi:hypothetical protein